MWSESGFHTEIDRVEESRGILSRLSEAGAGT